MARVPWLALAAGLIMLVDVVVSLAVAPGIANINGPLTTRIFYFHVPSAWVAYLAFGVSAIAGLVHLRRRDAASDAVALASAEVGTVFSIIALLTGLAWSSIAFVNYDPLRDAKVISLVVVVLAYFAYFALRSGIAEPARRKRLAAVYGLLALIAVPLSYLASQASIHPDFTRPDESLDPALGLYLLFSTIAFTVLYAALVELRYRLARVEAHLEENP